MKEEILSVSSILGYLGRVNGGVVSCHKFSAMNSWRAIISLWQSRQVWSQRELIRVSSLGEGLFLLIEIQDQGLQSFFLISHGKFAKQIANHTTWPVLQTLQLWSQEEQNGMSTFAWNWEINKAKFLLASSKDLERVVGHRPVFPSSCASLLLWSD